MPMYQYDSGPKLSERLATSTENLPTPPPLAQTTEKMLGSLSNIGMMLGYVHDTTKICRIWDFKSGRSGGRAVECSSLIFQEEENAHGKGADEEKNKVYHEQTENTT